MNKPTIKELIKHFKGSNTVECVRVLKNFTYLNDEKYIEDRDDCIVQMKNGVDNDEYHIILWDEIDGYAKIIPNQDRPDRYKSREVNGMDVIDLIKHWDLDFCDGNILKYLLRQKGEDIQDMEKIKDYAERKIKQLNLDIN